MSGESDRAAGWMNGREGWTMPDWAPGPEDLCMDTLLTAMAHAGLTRIDAAIANYYSTRVADPAEARWRSDYTRAHMRHDLAGDRPWPGHPDDVWLRTSARAIKQKWADDPVIGPRWAELNTLFIQTGGSYFFNQPTWSPTTPGAATPDVDPVTWRSQLQARDLAGHYRWPDITTTSDREDTEPMNDVTDPTHNTAPDQASLDYYAARGVHGKEAVMRADFDHAYRLRGQAAWSSVVGDPSEWTASSAQADALADQWRNSEDEELSQGWFAADVGVDAWNRYPSAMDDRYTDAEPEYLDSLHGRSFLQARELTDNGHWPDTAVTETGTEKQMRADFMHAWASSARDPEDFDPADQVEYAEYSDRWLSDRHWSNEWFDLENETVHWTENQELFSELGGSDAESRTPMQQRSIEQARHIAEHGIERDKYGLLTSHYVTRIDERSESTTSSPSPLADYQPGSALSAHAANCEHDGSER